jgi:putative transposase
MPRKPKPSHVVELPLATDPADCRRLLGMFTAGARLNNVLLQDGLRILDALRADPAWALARALPRASAEQRALRQEAFKAVRAAHGFTEFDFQARAIQHKNAAGFTGRPGSHVTQKLGSKVFAALEQYLFGKRGRPRFKGVKRPLHSLEGKNNAAALRWDSEAMFLVLDAGWGIPVKALNLAKDEWLWSALQGTVKYCRVLWRSVGGQRRYYAQLVMDGPPPKKASVLPRLAPADARAGLDLGPSNVARATATDAGVMPFCPEVALPAKHVRQLQRQLDRQRRANNPMNFDAQGRALRGKRWVSSKRQAGVENQLRDLLARTARQQANAHGRDINLLLERARHFRHDGVSVKSLQRNYGRSIGARAPGRLMSELQRKAESAGGNSSSVNVRQLKTSQYDHS